jgi:hypothetical protein
MGGDGHREWWVPKKEPGIILLVPFCHRPREEGVDVQTAVPQVSKDDIDSTLALLNLTQPLRTVDIHGWVLEEEVYHTRGVVSSEVL